MNTDVDSFLMNKCYRFRFEGVVEDPILNMHFFANTL